MCAVITGLLLLILELSSASRHGLHTSCSARIHDPWNSQLLAPRIESWLRSGVISDEEDSVRSMLFNQHVGIFTEHVPRLNDDRVVDMDQQFESLRELKKRREIRFNNDEQFNEDYPFFNENDWSAVTIGKFVNGVPTGLVWRWRSRRMEDGFLYGEVDSQGEFTGDNITHVYPDFKSGIRGTFVNGVLIAGVEVEITEERCNHGIKELRMKTVKKRRGIVWRRENLNSTFIGTHPTARDPFERRSTYVGQSGVPGSGEGVFAKRNFHPGQLVMYLSGLKMKREEIFPLGMKISERWIAGAYAFEFGLSFPGFPEDLCINQPPEYRNVEDYRTTLGHKVNHNLVGTNVEWGFVRHPSHGPVVSLIATDFITKGQEIFVDYHYDVRLAPPWYYHHEMEVKGIV